MADQHEHSTPVGSVAQEAARLLDAIGGWVSTSGYAAAPAPGDAADGAVTADDPDGVVPDGAASDTGRAEGAEVPPDETRTHAAGHCEHCGAASDAGRPRTCQWCPVCQGLDLLRSVRPETVDRLADLAGALATALRDVATHTRGTAGTPQGPTAPHHPGTRGPRVHDITVEDQDQGSATP